jgi:DNA-binding transcriptional LysR family regulator
VASDLPPLLARFRTEHPDIEISVLPVISELPGMLDFMAAAYAQAGPRA